MANNYIKYTDVTKEILDTVQINDLIKVNDWKKPMRVKGVSENFFVMIKKQFKDTYYSVCSKKPWNGIKHNAMRGGYFHCGRDYWVFGAPVFDYDFDNIEEVNKYLQTFETGESEISERSGIPIYNLSIKK